MRRSLIDIVAAERRQQQVTNTKRAGAVFWTFGAMLTGQINSGHGDGGFGGLHNPMSYSTFIFVFILSPVLLIVKLALH